MVYALRSNIGATSPGSKRSTACMIRMMDSLVIVCGMHTPPPCHTAETRATLTFPAQFLDRKRELAQRFEQRSGFNVAAITPLHLILPLVPRDAVNVALMNPGPP